MRIERLSPLVRRRSLRRPLFLAGVRAGFPSPADDYIEQQLDLNEHLVAHPNSTFFCRAVGDSMHDAGIHDGDLLIVDRSIKPHNGATVIALIDGEFTVKRLECRVGGLRLVPANPLYAAIEIEAHHDFEVWGVVTFVVHPL